MVARNILPVVLVDDHSVNLRSCCLQMASFRRGIIEVLVLWGFGDCQTLLHIEVHLVTAVLKLKQIVVPVEPFYLDLTRPLVT